MAFFWVFSLQDRLDKYTEDNTGWSCRVVLRISLKIQSEQFGITGIKEPTDILGRLEDRAVMGISCIVLIINQAVRTDV